MRRPRETCAVIPCGAVQNHTTSHKISQPHPSTISKYLRPPRLTTHPPRIWASVCRRVCGQYAGPGPDAGQGLGWYLVKLTIWYCNRPLKNLTGWGLIGSGWDKIRLELIRFDWGWTGLGQPRLFGEIDYTIGAPPVTSEQWGSS